MITTNFTKLINLINVLINELSVVHYNSFTNDSIILKGDSGATNHYVAPDKLHVLQNPTINNHIQVSLPDNTTLVSTHTGSLPIKNLSPTATTAHVLPTLSTSLLSLGQLANDGCIILLDKTYLKVFKNFQQILQG